MAAEKKSTALTRKRILDAAAQEFIEKGFEAASISQVARRARLSKQLVHHHFPGKEYLFSQVHEFRFRPSARWEESMPEQLADLIAERFKRRASNIDYMRVLTWEAASIRKGALPGEKERKQRIDRYGKELKLLQKRGKLAPDLNNAMMHLTILALASYPLCFSQITRLVVGKAGTDPAFQRAWIKHLKKIVARLIAPD